MHIPQLKPWSLVEVLTQKYEWPFDQAKSFAAFLLPMLSYEPSERATAEQCLRHHWLKTAAVMTPSTSSTKKANHHWTIELNNTNNGAGINADLNDEELRDDKEMENVEEEKRQRSPVDANLCESDTAPLPSYPTNDEDLN